MRRTAAAIVAAVALVAGAPVADAESAAVTYQPPVDAPVVDGFRPPPQFYAAGNRGIDYDTAPGAPVLAAAPGEVVFAGGVGFTRHVVVLHADGLRTSYSFLDDIAVARGQRVSAGQQVGTTAGRLHFGARAATAYLDPLLLFGSEPQVHLVDEPEPLSEAEERRGLVAFLAHTAASPLRLAGDAAGWVGAGVEAGADAVRQQAELALRGISEVGTNAEALAAWFVEQGVVPSQLARELGRTAVEWWRQRQQCTPPGVEPPASGEGRVLVTVGGLGSTSRPDGADVDNVDVEYLGYDDDDVVRFSYRGGTTAERPYEGIHTQVDLRDSAERLYDLLERLHRERPGVPIDIVAHSQGGLVARAALAYEHDPAGDGPDIGTLVTLATPHHGADLATASARVRSSLAGAALLDAAAAVEPSSIDPAAPSVRQLAEGSDFIRRLNRRPLPDDVRVVSIGARNDIVVPVPRSRLDGATNVVVRVPGWGLEHGALPGSEPAQRELRLALAGMAPTCQSLLDMWADTATGAVISAVEDGAGVGLAAVTGAPMPSPTRRHP